MVCLILQYLRRSGKKGEKNPPNCTIFDSWVFDNFILGDKLFEKTLRSLETCVSVSNNLCGKLVLSLEWLITFEERFKVTWVLFFIPDFNLLNCKLNYLYLKYIESFSIDIILK